MNDTLNQCQTVVDIHTVSDTVQTSYVGPVLASLSFSIALLALISYLKYHIDKRNKTVDYWSYFLEFPIDVGTIVISVLVAFNYLVGDIQYLMIALIVEILAMAIGMTMRNVVQEMLSEDNINVKKLRCALIGESSLVLIPAIITFILIL